MTGRSQPSPLGIALTLLRSVRSWSQKDLAAALGCGAPLVCDYEAGRKPLSRKRLEKIVGLLGLPAEAIDLTLSYVQSVLALAGPEGMAAGPAGAERVRLDAAVERVSQAATNFARAMLSVSTEARAVEARREAEALWDTLRRQPVEKRRLLVETNPQYRSWALCELVCAKSLEAAADRADKALDLAQLAVRMAELAPGDGLWRQRLQGYAWAHLGNARRVAGNLPSSEAAFDRARSLWEAGASGDPGFLNEARVIGLQASLCREQGHCPEALTLLDHALAIDKGEERLNLLINRASLLERTGDFEGAISALQEVIPPVSETNDPRLLFTLQFNLTKDLQSAGRPEEAQARLPRVRELASQIGNELDILRTHWLEGRIAAGLGRREEALLVLSRVKEDLASLGMAYDTALVLLELAVLYWEQGRKDTARSFARQVVPILRAQGIDRKAFPAFEKVN